MCGPVRMDDDRRIRYNREFSQLYKDLGTVRFLKWAGFLCAGFIWALNHKIQRLQWAGHVETTAKVYKTKGRPIDHTPMDEKTNNHDRADALDALGVIN